MALAEPNWAEQTTAWGTVALAIVTGALALAAFCALRQIEIATEQIKEARRDRNTQVAIEFATRWNDAAYRKVRTEVDRAEKRPGGIKQAMIQHHQELTEDYRLLLMEPDFFEDLGVVVNHGAIDFELVVDSLGRTICLRWKVWKSFVEHLRVERDMPSAFSAFADLAQKVEEFEAKKAAGETPREATAGDVAVAGSTDNDGTP